MAYKIAVCDDEKAETEYLSKIAAEWGALRKARIEICVFDSAESILFAVDDDKSLFVTV